jgi:hypothetical protein
MSLRFRRRIKIIPGVHLNISRSGISTSVGVRGASVTLGKRGTYLNAGVPGTGVSWRGRISTPATSQPASELPTSETASITRHSHHLHWWKIALFVGAMLLAGATKSNAVIGAFWVLSIGFWIFLFLRLLVRAMNSNIKQSNGPTN